MDWDTDSFDDRIWFDMRRVNHAAPRRHAPPVMGQMSRQLLYELGFIDLANRSPSSSNSLEIAFSS